MSKPLIRTECRMDYKTPWIRLTPLHSTFSRGSDSRCVLCGANVRQQNLPPRTVRDHALQSTRQFTSTIQFIGNGFSFSEFLRKRAAFFQTATAVVGAQNPPFSAELSCLLQKESHRRRVHRVAVECESRLARSLKCLQTFGEHLAYRWIPPRQLQQCRARPFL